MTTELHRMIHTQPDTLEQVANIDVTAQAHALRAADRFIIVGTGTSFHAAELAAYLLRTGGADAIAVSAVDAARWQPEPRRDTGYVIISHTGSTAYALRLRQAVQAAGGPLVTITGQTSGWDEAIATPTEEASETYTVSYAAALGVLGLLAHQLVGTPTGPQELLRAATAVRGALAHPQIAQISTPTRSLAIVGPGPWSITANEGALKIRESAHILAEGFDPERLLHGAAVPYTAEDILIGLQPAADVDGLTGQLLDAAQAEGITTHVLEDDFEDLHPYHRQLPSIVRLQLLASQLTDVEGTDPDTAITGAWARDTLWSTGAPAETT